MRYCLFFSCLLFSICCRTANDPVPGSGPVKEKNIKLQSFAARAKEFVTQKGYNTSFCFLVDLSFNSGQKRFFVYDLTKDSVVEQGLVAHGHCKELFQRTVKMSNEPGCNCSSGGKYKIAHRYAGSFGTAYKLIGLDSSNSNAYKRFIVLHAHECVPDTETYPNQICRSEGCPTVSPAFLKKLSARIDVSAKPVLMWVF